MKVKVLGFEEHKGRTAIRFESPIGYGRAMWSSTSVPRVGREYDVEFGVDDVIEKGRNAYFAKNRTYAISSRDGEIELNGGNRFSR